MISETIYDQQYWDAQYKAGTTGWDLGAVSPPLKAYIDQLTDKNISILIPGAGNSYEAVYLLQKEFTDITIVDIAPSVIVKLQAEFKSSPHIKIMQADFFTYQGQYDLIIEQTFFCAIQPAMRERYVSKMYELLKPTGRLVGLLFNRVFEKGPPFGGSKTEYEKLFCSAFEYKTFAECYNSVKPRSGSELFINFKKRLKAHFTN